MRKATFAGVVFVVCGSAASAQLSLTPKAGIEQSFTSVGYTNQSRFSPLGPVVSPQFSVRLDYRFKNIHGPFVGLATSRSQVAYEFTGNEPILPLTKASKGDMQLRLEAGYMYSSPAIKLGKAKPATRPAAPAVTQKRCGYYAMSHCGSKARMAQQAAIKKNEPMNLRIQPFAGMAFIPDPKTNLTTNSSDVSIVPTNFDYKYNAGNWNTAFIAGTNFEMGKGAQRKFVVGVQYLKGLGNLGTETLNNESNPGTTVPNKATITGIRSGTSAWNVTVGVPISLTKKKTVARQTMVTAPALAPAVPQPEIKKPEARKSSCSQYRTRCGNWQ